MPMPIYVNLKSYLDDLRAIERRKQGKRLHVPSIKELAEGIGKHTTTVSRIANNHVNELSLETAGLIIVEMRRRGFNMDISDLLVFRPEESEVSNAQDV